jgi:hypothetical protein
MKRLKWTDQERSQVLREAKRIWLESDGWSGIDRKSLYEAAQMVLPVERRHTKNPNYHIRSLVAAMNAQRGEEKRAPLMTPPPVPYTPSLERVLAENGAAILVSILRSPDVILAIQDLARRFYDAPSVPAPNSWPIAEVEEKLPRVLIVGLQGQQVDPIAAEYGKRARLKFATAEEYGRVKANIGSADHIIGMIKFISHPMDKIAGNAKSYIRVNGSGQDLRRTLESLLS